MEQADQSFFEKPGVADTYEQGPRWFIPGYDASHAMAAVMLRDRLGEHAEILVFGAGGGVELGLLAQECRGWRFFGVDPSAAMLARAEAKIAAIGAQDRVTLMRGYAENMPQKTFDAATAFLVLPFIPDDGRRLAAMQAIAARLKPGAPFLMINACADMKAPSFEDDLRRYAAFARRSGAPSEMVEGAVAMQRTTMSFVTAEREEALPAQAGFENAEVFYRALMMQGWIANRKG